jgi:hypothetical protein
MVPPDVQLGFAAHHALGWGSEDRDTKPTKYGILPFWRGQLKPELDRRRGEEVGARTEGLLT